MALPSRRLILPRSTARGKGLTNRLLGCCMLTRRWKDGVERLRTVWVLARAFEDEARTKPTQPWNSFLVNADVFTRRD